MATECVTCPRCQGERFVFVEGVGKDRCIRCGAFGKLEIEPLHRHWKEATIHIEAPGQVQEFLFTGHLGAARAFAAFCHLAQAKRTGYATAYLFGVAAGGKPICIDPEFAVAYLEAQAQ